MIRFTPAVVISLLISVHAVVISAEDDGQDAQDALTATLTKLNEDSDNVGLGVGIVDGDTSELIYAQGFGEANKERGFAYTADTFQPIASISKTLIGVALMKAQDLELLTLDDPINDYLPFPVNSPHHPDMPILIRHLAQHTSSMRDTKDYEKAYLFRSEISSQVYLELPRSKLRQQVRKLFRQYNRNRPMSQERFLRSIYHPDGPRYKAKRSFLLEPPGTVYEYSNNGAALASMVIEGATNMSYTDFVQTHILDPLGMTESKWDLADFAVKEKARLYPFGMSPIPDFVLITLADGGFVTNVQEFSLYLGAMIRGFFADENNKEDESAILSPAAFRQMFDEGIFWEGDFVGPNTYGFSGGDPGISTLAFFHTETKTGYIYFTNTMDDTLISPVLNNLFDYGLNAKTAG